MSERWIWKGDGKESEAFSERSDAVRAAAAEFHLSISEVHALSHEGWIPLGQYSDLWIIDKATRGDF